MPDPSLTTGLQNLITDVSGLQVGHAQDADLLSGVTVVTASGPLPQRFT